MNRASLAIAMLLVSLPARLALADDAAAAEELFREGKRLLEVGEIEPACLKLAESQRLDPSSGTLINLASCHERQGRFATARAEYLAAARLAHEQGKDDRAAVAQGKADDLAARVPRLTILVRSPLPSQQVSRDGSALADTSYGVALEVDPGAHRVESTAPGHQTFAVDVPLNVGESRILEIAPLQPIVAPPPVPSPKPAASPARPPRDAATPTGSSGPPVASWIVGGVSVAAIGVGAGFGIASLGANSDAEKACPDPTACSSKDGTDAADRRDAFGWVSNVSIGAGIVGLGAAAVLWVVAPSGSAKVGSAFVAPAPSGIRGSF